MAANRSHEAPGVKSGATMRVMGDLVSEIHDWLDGEPRTTEEDLKAAAALLQRAERILTTHGTVVDGAPSDLADLAMSVVRQLRARIGVDLAFVFVLRTSDGNMGVSLDGGTIPIDTACMLTIEGMGHVRNAVIKSVVDRQTSGG
jgi:hypothetical protein